MYIDVDPEPIVGSHLHRRMRQPEGEVLCPEYQGPALRERAAIEEAIRLGFKAVMFRGQTLVLIGEKWYRVNTTGRCY